MSPLASGFKIPDLADGLGVASTAAVMPTCKASWGTMSSWLLAERVPETMRAYGSFDAWDFDPLASGGGHLPSIPDHFDLTGIAIVHLLHSGMYADESPEDAGGVLWRGLRRSRSASRTHALSSAAAEEPHVVGKSEMREFVAGVSAGNLRQ